MRYTNLYKAYAMAFDIPLAVYNFVDIQFDEILSIYTEKKDLIESKKII